MKLLLLPTRFAPLLACAVMLHAQTCGGDGNIPHCGLFFFINAPTGFQSFSEVDYTFTGSAFAALGLEGPADAIGSTDLIVKFTGGTMSSFGKEGPNPISATEITPFSYTATGHEMLVGEFPNGNASVTATATGMLDPSLFTPGYTEIFSFSAFAYFDPTFSDSGEIFSVDWIDPSVSLTLNFVGVPTPEPRWTVFAIAGLLIVAQRFRRAFSGPHS